MKIFIADDEPLARKRIKSLLAELGGHEVVGEGADGQQVLMAMYPQPPEVVLLDIRMPLMDGLEAARHLSQLSQAPAVIFTTAYGEYALQAFEANAIDYVLKPVKSERLAAALTKASAFTRTRAAVIAQTHRRQHLSAVVKGRIQLVPVVEVSYLLADQKYVSVFWHGGEVLIEDSLKSLENEFPEMFMRLHRNTLVALTQVAGMEKTDDGETVVLLRNRPERLAVSRRLVADVRQRMLHRGWVKRGGEV